ncbi:hypothetical protein [Chryseobacterium sp. SIMBA_029]|uniref:hypothetical protein n=1 Tax=Chryseobacterium sp. SIMBA_029 TaxID=3085772 RepID=UPI00397C7FA4
MSNIFDFLKSINDLSERAKSLNALSSSLHIQMSEMTKLSNINIQPNVLAALMPISKLITNNSFQNSLINVNKISDSINIATISITQVFHNFDFQKTNQSFTISDSTLSALSKLAKQQEDINKNLFGSLSSINSISIAASEINKIKNLNIAFTSLSSEIAKIASLNQNWNIIEDFEDLTTDAIFLSDQLVGEHNEVNIESFSIRFNFFLKSVEEFYQKNKEAGIIMLFVIDVILRFAGLHQYYDFIKDKPESATKIETTELKNTQTVIISTLEEVKKQISKKNKVSYTNKKCYIKLKPNSRAIVINELPKKYEIIILKTQPTWVLINFFDPNDGLPQTGWINAEDIK